MKQHFKKNIKKQTKSLFIAPIGYIQKLCNNKDLQKDKWVYNNNDLSITGNNLYSYAIVHVHEKTGGEFAYTDNTPPILYHTLCHRASSTSRESQ